MSIAIVFGVAAALSGGVCDSILSRLVDMLFAIPTLLLALVFVTVFGPSVLTEVIAVGISTAPGYARMHLKNIWIIVAISVGAILVVEPILTVLLFRDVPTVGSLIGLVLGAFGVLAAMFL